MYRSPLLVHGGPGGPPDAEEFKHGLIGPVELETSETQYQNVHLLSSSVERLKNDSILYICILHVDTPYRYPIPYVYII